MSAAHLQLTRLAKELDLDWKKATHGRGPLSYDKFTDLLVARYWENRNLRLAGEPPRPYLLVDEAAA